MTHFESQLRSDAKAFTSHPRPDATDAIITAIQAAATESPTADSAPIPFSTSRTAWWIRGSIAAAAVICVGLTARALLSQPAISEHQTAVAVHTPTTADPTIGTASASELSLPTVTWPETWNVSVVSPLDHELTNISSDVMGVGSFLAARLPNISQVLN